jgi:hypothetical protein
MTQRITDVDIARILHRINTALEAPVKPWITDENNILRSQPGCHILDNAYGGYSLRKLLSPDGAETAITSGYIPKRQVYAQMQAYLAGIMVGKQISLKVTV